MEPVRREPTLDERFRRIEDVEEELRARIDALQRDLDQWQCGRGLQAWEAADVLPPEAWLTRCHAHLLQQGEGLGRFNFSCERPQQAQYGRLRELADGLDRHDFKTLTLNDPSRRGHQGAGVQQAAQASRIPKRASSSGKFSQAPLKLG